jgi:AAA domain, putative AbiEii toxin, Type IV TA system
MKQFRSFVDSGEIETGPINVFIGENNSGKSTVLKSIQVLQQGFPNPFPDIRIGTPEAVIEMQINRGGIQFGSFVGGADVPFLLRVNLTSSPAQGQTIKFEATTGNGTTQFGDIRVSASEPNHVIVPFLARRRVANYVEDIREQFVNAISQDASNLPAKLSRLGNSAFPFHSVYREAIEAILGFTVTAVPSSSGQLPGVYLSNGQALLIDRLGEGVHNIVHLLVNLAVSKDQIFLIEEPENDLHPKALKALLDLIIASSSTNQFFISTHSNIVVRHLCASAGSQLYQIRPKSTQLPFESEINLVAPEPTARLAALAELGYSLSDSELWEGWLIFEESSAERIVTEFLIPYFVPSLSRVRTLAAAGASKVVPAFEELHRLFLFTHLTPIYKSRALVIVDGDTAGQEAIDKLKSKFDKKLHDKFIALSMPAFERYFPKAFEIEIETVLGMSDPIARRSEKKSLLINVIHWLQADRTRATQALSESASEIIDLLKRFESTLSGQSQEKNA